MVSLKLVSRLFFPAKVNSVGVGSSSGSRGRDASFFERILSGGGIAAKGTSAGGIAAKGIFAGGIVGTSAGSNAANCFFAGFLVGSSAGGIDAKGIFAGGIDAKGILADGIAGTSAGGMVAKGIFPDGSVAKGIFADGIDAKGILADGIRGTSAGGINAKGIFAAPAPAAKDTPALFFASFALGASVSQFINVSGGSIFFTATGGLTAPCRGGTLAAAAGFSAAAAVSATRTARWPEMAWRSHNAALKLRTVGFRPSSDPPNDRSASADFSPA